MHKITLSNIIPEIFTEVDQESDIWNQTIEFDKGNTYLIEADSGKGKSSLFSYIYGYRNDFVGNIFFDNYNIDDIKEFQWDNIHKQSISILFQELRIFPELTVKENIALKNSLTNYKTELEIMYMLEVLEIDDKISQKCEKLSWGQQQRTAIVRTLCQPIDFLLLDEPISHIDNRMADIVANLIIREAKRQNAGIIVSSIGKVLPLKYDKIYSL